MHPPAFRRRHFPPRSRSCAANRLGPNQSQLRRERLPDGNCRWETRAQILSRPHPYKLYVSELFTPSGIQVLRDSPHDHVHHRALMYAIGIDGVDFWSEFPDQQPAKQDSDNRPVVRQLRAAAVTPAFVKRSTGSPGREGAGRGRSKHHVPFRPERCRPTDMAIHLQPPNGKESVELWGRHYFGLGMRFVESMDKGGRFFSPSNEEATEVRGTEQLVRAPWCAFTAKVDGKQVTVAMFDDPQATLAIRQPGSQ